MSANSNPFFRQQGISANSPASFEISNVCLLMFSPLAGALQCDWLHRMTLEVIKERDCVQSDGELRENAFQK